MMTKNKKQSSRPQRDTGSSRKVHRVQASTNPSDVRRTQTEAEKIFWNAINAKRFHGYKFVRAYAIGSYTVPFACITARLIVDIDSGKQSDNRKDEAKKTELTERGYGLLHLSSHDVVEDIESVLHTLLKHLRKAG
jgi:very-short-patch-repair endonuclease